MWIYEVISEDEFAVGFYDPTGQFHVDSTWPKRGEARGVVHWLNGGNIPEGFPGHAKEEAKPKSKPLNK